MLETVIVVRDRSCSISKDFRKQINYIPLLKGKKEKLKDFTQRMLDTISADYDKPVVIGVDDTHKVTAFLKRNKVKFMICVRPKMYLSKDEEIRESIRKDCKRAQYILYMSRSRELESYTSNVHHYTGYRLSWSRVSS